MTLIMWSSDHDKREDLSAELWTVRGLLIDAGQLDAAKRCETAALQVRDEEISLSKATRLLCDFENELDG
ncbi:hypothetical protein PBI_MAMINIAINA_97 [Mycobacterium phage Maminiaina]|nr:hypothetical protein PBI_MAMINIAINA_97 [Mycobacterium phage Maminiaina]